MVRSTCAYLGCATVIRRRPKTWHSARPLSVAAAALARERRLLHDQGHVIACVRHRKQIYELLPSSALLPPVSEPASPLPAAVSSSSSSSSPSVHMPDGGLPMAVLLSAVQLSISTPAVVLQSTSPQSFLHLPSVVAPVQPGVRPLAFGDRRAPTHPHAEVVHPRQQPRFRRALTGPEVEEQSQQRQEQESGDAGTQLGTQLGAHGGESGQPIRHLVSPSDLRYLRENYVPHAALATQRAPPTPPPSSLSGLDLPPSGPSPHPACVLHRAPSSPSSATALHLSHRLLMHGTHCVLDNDYVRHVRERRVCYTGSQEQN